MTTQEFIDFCRNLILKLESFDKIFETLNIIDIHRKTIHFFKEGLSDFNFETLFPIINEEDIAYKNKDISKSNLTPSAKSWAGFSAIFFLGGQNNINSIPEVSLKISQGSYENRSASINIEYSEKLKNKLTKDYIINLIEIISSIVEVKFANAITSKFFLKVRKKGQKSIGWINYTDNKRIDEILMLNEKRKELPEGIIFSISDKKSFNEDDPVLVKRAIELSDFLSSCEQ